MALNFQANIELDISAFLASMEKAEAAVKSLNTQITNLNTQKINPAVSPVPGATPGGVPGATGAALTATRVRQTEAADTSRDLERNLARERYALYDVAATYTAIAFAATKAIKAVAGTAIEYERSFADVQRTTDFTSAKIGEAARSAKNDLKELASEIPVAFGEVSRIATIGNQLGIAQGAITAFTETVAKFSTVTGISVDSTAMAFGRIGELLGVPAAEFEKLGSSIAFAGVNAVATEEQILSVTKEIATTAKMANFTSAETVGLATALSSLGIAPEAARGSIIRTFAGINKAISEGGVALDKYASIAGMSGEQFAAVWQESGEKAFGFFLEGLQNMSDNGKNLDTVLRDIGMKNVRDIQTVQKLGDNYAVYASSIEDANQGFREGQFLSDAYGVVQETVAAKIQLIQNNWNNLLDTLGQGIVGDQFKLLLDGINQLLIKLNQIAKSPAGQAIAAVSLAITASIIVVAAFNAITALAGASIRAFAVANTALAGAQTTATVTTVQQTGALTSNAAASNLAAGGMTKAKIAALALSKTLRAIPWVLAIGAGIDILEKLSAAFTPVEQKAENLLGGFSGLQDALNADLSAYTTALSDLGGDVEGAQRAAGVIGELNTNLENNNTELNKAITAQNTLNNFVGLGSNNVQTLSTEMESLNFVIGENTYLWLANAIAQSEAFKAMSPDALNKLIDAGFNLRAALNAAANNNLDQYMATVRVNLMETEGAFFTIVEALRSFSTVAKNELKGTLLENSVVVSALIDFYQGWAEAILNVFNAFTKLFGIDFLAVSNALRAANDATQGVTVQSTLFGASLKGINDEIAQSNMDVYNEQLEDMRKKAGGAAKELRTVVDYANDLRSVFSRVYEIKFGRKENMDQINSGWNRMAEEADKAREAIRKANTEINDLTADKSILQYQLAIAEKYGDQARAAKLRAQIATVDGKIADKRETIAEANETLTKTTKGNTQASIDNRSALREQIQAYMTQVEILAKTGLKGKALTKEIDRLKQSFIENATAVGYSREELDPYIKLFDQMKVTVEKMPRNVDIEFKSNVEPARQAIKEFLAKNKDHTITITTTVVQPDTVKMKKLVDGDTYRMLLRAYERGAIKEPQFMKTVYGVTMASGGPVIGPGSSTSDSIPAMLSNGEYVVRASAVKAYGLDFMNALNQQKVGSFTGGGAALEGMGGGTTIAYLSPEDRALLRSVIDRPIALYTENTKIAQSANAGNVLLGKRGAN